MTTTAPSTASYPSSWSTRLPTSPPASSSFSFSQSQQQQQQRAGQQQPPPQRLTDYVPSSAPSILSTTSSLSMSSTMTPKTAAAATTAKSAAATAARAKAANNNNSNNKGPPEVSYHAGATALFLAVEELEWRQAVDVLEAHPEQASVWVVSRGTLETSFSWSVWRRLPLHEACRRQAPAWVIAALLAVYPAAAAAYTQFGELPLHLAVAHGACPEVVNLLLVWHWPGISHMDQGGRTPLEILCQSEVLDLEHYRMMYESLFRAQEMWNTLQEQHAAALQALQAQHESGLKAIHKQHEEDLAVEQKHVMELLKQLEASQDCLAASAMKETVLQQQLERQVEQERLWTKQIDLTQQRCNDLEEEKRQELLHVEALQEALECKNKEIADMKEQVGDLKTALQRLTAFQKHTVTKQLRRTQASLQGVLDSFVDLDDLLGEHGQELSALLKEIGVEELPSEVDVQEQEDDDEEDENHQEANAKNNGQNDDDDDDDEVDEEEKRDVMGNERPTRGGGEAEEGDFAADMVALTKAASSALELD